MKLFVQGFSTILLLGLLSVPSVQGNSPIAHACLTTSETKVPLRNLRSYTIQYKPLFSVNAVRFLTCKGATICSYPSSAWAIKAMKYLDEKKKQHNLGLKNSACSRMTSGTD